MTAFLFALLLVSAPTAPTAPQTITGKVVSITDGDTVKVLQGSEQFKIRLNRIDCPEKKQAYGTKSKTALSEKIFGKEVRIEYQKKDKYGRILGDVYQGERWINKEMIAEGWAWHYRYFDKSKELEQAEKQAREKKNGLWADKEPIPPWEFRKGKR
jgi:endonuclease YncB( thermonuclease family)